MGVEVTQPAALELEPVPIIQRLEPVDGPRTVLAYLDDSSELARVYRDWINSDRARQPLETHGDNVRIAPAGARGSGQGLFATRAFAPGELILTERALLISSNTLLTVSSRSAGPDRLEPLYRALAGRLEPDDRRALEALDTCVDDDGPGGALSGRIRTNVIGLKPPTPLTDGHAHGGGGGNGAELLVGVFAVHSRINHSCRPTVFWAFSTSTMALSLRALVGIAAGAELFATYTDATRPRLERMATLAKTWGFVCLCAGCATADDRRASDARLAQFRTVAGRARADQADLDSAVAAYDLLAQEGHVVGRCEWSWVPCRAALLRGDAEAARTWARTAVEAYTLTHGAESEVIGVLKGVVEHPERHPLWRAKA